MHKGGVLLMAAGLFPSFFAPRALAPGRTFFYNKKRGKLRAAPHSASARQGGPAKRAAPKKGE